MSMPTHGYLPNNTMGGLVASSDAVDMHTVATVNLFTVPAGKKFMPVGFLISPNHSMASAVVTFGQTADKDSFAAGVTLTNLTATTGGFWVRNINAATPVAAEMPAWITAGQIVCIDITTGATANPATATIDVFGFMKDV